MCIADRFRLEGSWRPTETERRRVQAELSWRGSEPRRYRRAKIRLSATHAQSQPDDGSSSFDTMPSQRPEWVESGRGLFGDLRRANATQPMQLSGDAALSLA